MISVKMGYKVVEIDREEHSKALQSLYEKFGPTFSMGARVSKDDKKKIFLVLPEVVYDALRKTDIPQRLIGETYTVETIWSRIWEAEAKKSKRG